MTAAIPRRLGRGASAPLNPAYTVAWRANNTVRCREGERAWRAEHPEAVSLAGHTYYRRTRLAQFLGRTRRRAELRGLDFDLTLEWLESIWVDTCPISGLRLESSRGGARYNSPSLDRVDSTRGYVQGNCRVVAWCMNAMKGTMTESEFQSVLAALRASDPTGVES